MKTNYYYHHDTVKVKNNIYVFFFPKKKRMDTKYSHGEKRKTLTIRKMPQPEIGALMPFTGKSFRYNRAALLILSTTALHQLMFPILSKSSVYITSSSLMQLSVLENIRDWNTAIKNALRPKSPVSFLVFSPS
jgi:hypothetical protein